MPEPAREGPLTQLPIIVRPDPAGRFLASPIGIPEIQVVADTPQQAVAQVQQALTTWGGAVYWVSPPVTPPPRPAYLDLAGHARDDPDFHLYLEEIQRYRREVDERECSDSSSTPTT